MSPKFLHRTKSYKSGKVSVKRSQLSSFQKSKLCDRALYFYNQAQSRLDVLSIFGITKERQLSFQELIRAYSDTNVSSGENPIPRRATRKNLNLQYGIKMLEEMDSLVKYYKNQYPDFYKRWFEVRTLNSLTNHQEQHKGLRKRGRKSSYSSTKKYLEVFIKDSEGHFIQDVTAIISTITPRNWVVYKVAKTGKFRSTILQKGTYSVKVSKEGWRTLVQEFDIKGNMNEILNLVLQKA